MSSSIQKYRIYLSVRAVHTNKQVADITYLIVNNAEVAESIIEGNTRNEIYVNSLEWQLVYNAMKQLYQPNDLLFVWMKECIN